MLPSASSLILKRFTASTLDTSGLLRLSCSNFLLLTGGAGEGGLTMLTVAGAVVTADIGGLVVLAVAGAVVTADVGGLVVLAVAGAL